MKRVLTFMVMLQVATAFAATPSLEEGFAQPPEQTKPWCYWYWISDHVSKEGITRDLEAMARVGIGEALVGNIFLDDVPAGKVKVLSPDWWDLVAHALREGGRTGVNIGLFNCPGWSQSGGPWIAPTQTMRRLAWTETKLTGPRRFVGALPTPAAAFQDVAVLAFPTPARDTESLCATNARLTTAPPADGVARLVDGDPGTALAFPAGAGRGRSPFTVELAAAAPFTARSLELTPGPDPFGAQVELQAATTGGWQTVRAFRCDRSNMGTGVGFLPRGPVVVSFPAVTASAYRVVFTGLFGPAKAPALAELRLSAAARLEHVVEKQLGKMHPTPLPMWDTYLWPTAAEPDEPALVVPAEGVRDLAGRWSAACGLDWEVPPGEWTVLRIGMTPTGMRNGPASPEGQGLEVDKMNAALARRHFDAFIGEVLRRVPAAERTAFTRVVADSYEMGSQNWTDGLADQFRARYGYDPKSWLPALTGRLVGGADRSERFLWDLRRLVADRVATDYVGGLRDACRAHGLGLWLENYGHWGFPGEFLMYGGASDRVGGEYWVTGDLGSIECRAASSCANTYGQPFVSAEAFTGGPPFQNAPAALKARGDWSFAEGVNHFVLHVCIQQPWDDRAPGVNAWFGTEFNRHNTWFESGRAWIDYLRRCCWLLQQGTRVADVAYFIGEDAPKMTGVRKPALPPGRDFDYINAEVIEKTLAVKDGELVLPHGTRYRVLVLPELDTMRPAVLRKIRDLVQAGATVLGPPPSRSPSLENYPAADAEVRALAAELWGGADGKSPGQRAFGQGRIVWGRPLEEVLDTPPDFTSDQPLRFTHRRTADGADLYFVANSKNEPLTVSTAFRAGARAPELWHPDTGERESPALYDVAGGLVRLPLTLGPHESLFVVFRQPAAPPGERVVRVGREGFAALSAGAPTAAAAEAADGPPGAFTIAAWVRPAAATTLVIETNRGVHGLGDSRNDLLAAPHGGTFGGDEHAGCGLAVGANGVCVFEHGANYFCAPLVHPAALTNWTHVAVVYRDQRPTLYLDGRPVRTGLRSERLVHSGAGGGIVSGYRGAAGSLRALGRALDDAEIAALARAMPRPDQVAAGPGLRLVSRAGRLVAQVEAAGRYELAFGDGRSAAVVAEVPPARPVPGPWEVRFLDGRGAPERLTFDALADWTTRSEEGVRHYAGRALYRRTLALPPAAGTRSVLDLGAVRDLATVRVNGRELATLWHAPFRVDVTDALRAGDNELEIEVVNVWNNRLVGDLAKPADQRSTFLLAPTVKANAPLLPAGLLGPVTLRHVVEQEVR